MKLLLTMNLPYFPAHGGANKANRYLAEGFAALDHEVEVVAPALGVPSDLTVNQLVERLRAEGASVHREADAVAFQLKNVTVHAITDPGRMRAHLVDRLKAWQPDWALVSSEEPTQNLLNAAVESYAGRVVYLAHTPTFLPFGPQSFYPSTTRTQLLERANGIVAVSKFMDRYIREHSRLDPSTMYLPVFGPGPFPVLGRFDNPYVTMINPCRLKGIDIFAGLARSMPAIAFAAVPTWGTTPSDRALLEAIPNVTLLEPSADINQIFEQTRVVLMPSLWQECFGLTVVEAMLRGIPTIASDVGGLPEAKLGTGFLIPVNPIESFSNELDENTIPKSGAPENDIGPWRDALQTLLAGRDTYDDHAAIARDRALRFHASVSIRAWERYLLDLTPGASAVRARKERDSVEHTPDALSALSPQQRALLLQKLKKKSLTPAPQRQRNAQ
jgi:glycosyltransferase involved in cell wall biosynthesis